jgi:hypothetical protein
VAGRIACWATGGEAVAILGRGDASVGSAKLGPPDDAAPLDRSADASGREVRCVHSFPLDVLPPAAGLDGGCKTERPLLLERSGVGAMPADCWGEGPGDATAGPTTVAEPAESPNAESRKESNRS